MSIFHALPYSESLFCLLGSVFILALPDRAEPAALRTHILFAALAGFLMSLTRNVAIQIVPSAVFASVMTAISTRGAQKYLVLTTATAAAAVAGFSLYGLWNLHCHGDFWRVFTVQSHWEKRIGLDWSLLVRPKTWTPSTNVLFWDVLAFHVPLVVTGAALADALRFRFRADARCSPAAPYDYTFWFSTMFALAHVGIVWATQPDFHSLARYVFAMPFTFVAMGGVLERLPRRIAAGILVLLLVLSAIFLANWWGRFARLSWLG